MIENIFVLVVYYQLLSVTKCSCLLVADIQNQTILKKLLHFLKSNSNIAQNPKNQEKQINFENITRIVF